MKEFKLSWTEFHFLKKLVRSSYWMGDKCNNRIKDDTCSGWIKFTKDKKGVYIKIKEKV